MRIISSSQLLTRFNEAMARLYHSGAFELPDETSVFMLDCPDIGLEGAPLRLLREQRESLGFILLDSLDEADNLRAHTVRGVFFDDASNPSENQLPPIELAGKKVCLRPVFIDPGHIHREPELEDVEMLMNAAQAVARVIEDHPERLERHEHFAAAVPLCELEIRVEVVPLLVPGRSS